MRRVGLTGAWRASAEGPVDLRSRVFGTARTTARQHLTGVLSAESLFRLLLAFVLATALWLYVTSRNAPDASVLYGHGIQISAINEKSNLTLRSILPDVHITVRPGENGAPTSSFEATVNLQGLGTGFHNHVPVDVSQYPSSVLGYSPQYVSIVLERIVSKSVKVRVQMISPPPNGFTIQSKSLYTVPTRVLVSGGRSYVEQVSSAVVPLSLSSARSGINKSALPILENDQGRQLFSRVTISPQRVVVHAIIQQLASFKTLPILANIVGQPAAGVAVTSIRVAPTAITAYGAQGILSGLQNLQTQSIRVRGLHAGVKAFTVPLRMPGGVHVHVKNVKVTVTIGRVTKGRGR